MRRRLVPIVAAILATLVAFYAVIVRPKFLRWGATQSEMDGPWPGDNLVSDPVSTVTRAITIHAPASAIWPWIVQIGQNRAGFYSYTWLENAVGARMPRIDRIIPEFQHRSVGDTVWLASPSRYGGLGRMVVAVLVPERAMILTTPSDAERVFSGRPIREGTWGFMLDQEASQTTRLVMRSVGAAQPLFPARLASALLFDSAHFIMEQKMMREIKRLAESNEIPARAWR
ncbi:MAG: hypothetical protein ACXVAM_04940 [Vulcanimicrobiaceae bacterium]